MAQQDSQANPARQATEAPKLGRDIWPLLLIFAVMLLVSVASFQVVERETKSDLVEELANTPDSHSILQLQVRDPGGDMISGFKPSLVMQDRPLTLMAADAIAGNAGVNVEGYRDYRGVSVTGADQPGEQCRQVYRSGRDYIALSARVENRQRCGAAIQCRRQRYWYEGGTMPAPV